MPASKKHSELVVGDVMSPAPVTTSADDSIEDAEAEMERSDIRHLPVLDDGEIIGMLSDRDLRWATKSSTVGDLMSEDVMSVTTETRLCDASAVILDQRISALPVVDDAGRLVGIITDTDFVRIAHQVCGGAAMSVEDP